MLPRRTKKDDNKSNKNKTTATEASVESYFSAIGDEARRADCRALAALMEKATGQKPKMWGTSIVGFGSRHYQYESGREGDICAVGFSSRKAAIVLYGLGSCLQSSPLASALGRYTTGKGCLYLARLSDVDQKVLKQLILQSNSKD